MRGACGSESKLRRTDMETDGWTNVASPEYHHPRLASKAPITQVAGAKSQPKRCTPRCCLPRLVHLIPCYTAQAHKRQLRQ